MQLILVLGNEEERVACAGEVDGHGVLLVNQLLCEAGLVVGAYAVPYDDDLARVGFLRLEHF